MLLIFLFVHTLEQAHLSLSYHSPLTSYPVKDLGFFHITILIFFVHVWILVKWRP